MEKMPTSGQGLTPWAFYVIGLMGGKQIWARYLEGDNISTKIESSRVEIEIGEASSTFWKIEIEIGEIRGPQSQ